MAEQRHLTEVIAGGQAVDGRVRAVRRPHDHLDLARLDDVDVARQLSSVALLEDHLAGIVLFEDESALGEDCDQDEEYEADQQQPLHRAEAQEQERIAREHAEQADERDETGGHLGDRDGARSPVAAHEGGDRLPPHVTRSGDGISLPPCRSR